MYWYPEKKKTGRTWEILCTAETFVAEVRYLIAFLKIREKIENGSTKFRLIF